MTPDIVEDKDWYLWRGKVTQQLDDILENQRINKNSCIICREQIDSRATERDKRIRTLELTGSKNKIVLSIIVALSSAAGSAFIYLIISRIFGKV